MTAETASMVDRRVVGEDSASLPLSPTAPPRQSRRPAKVPARKMRRSADGMAMVRGRQQRAHKILALAYTILVLDMEDAARSNLVQLDAVN
jgi:alkylhydroperoxidase family enzyme